MTLNLNVCEDSDNRIVHEYFGVDLKIIWQILRKDIPAFKTSLSNIRSQLGE